MLSAAILPLARSLRPSAILQRLGWATFGFGISQSVRLASNIVLARLLAPEIFGIMLIVNTLRTGMEMISDLGIGQSVVANDRGEERAFLNTAWTVQILRGFVLAAGLAAAAYPLSKLYRLPELAPIIAVSALFIVAAGFMSMSKFVAQRRQYVRRLAIFEGITAIVASTMQVILAWYWPSVWALVWGGILSAILTSAVSFLIVPDLKLRWGIERSSAREIFKFGKWIFLATILYFAATNFDRLYLGAAIPLGLLGVYSVARSLAEVAGILVTNASNAVIFPTIASMRGDLAGLKAKIASRRRPMLLLAVIGIAGFTALSDTIIQFLYDDRYHLAGSLLPPLVIGIWFSILTIVGESILLGIGRPAYGAYANAAKLVWLVIAVPLGLASKGIGAALIAIAAADLFRYLPVIWAQRREGLSFLRQDVMLTSLLMFLVILFRYVSGLIGLTTGLEGWADQARALFG